MLSSGVDSVYALLKILCETDDVVLAHHLHLINQENRAGAEAVHCRNIVKWARENIRDFHYTESAVDRRGLPIFGLDLHTVGFESALAAAAWNATHESRVDRILTGICREDEGAEDLARTQVAGELLGLNFDPQGHAPAFDYLHPVISKRAELDYLPAALRNLVWYCRRPVWQDDGIPKPCGECHTCRIVAGETLDAPAQAAPEQATPEQANAEQAGEDMPFQVQHQSGRLEISANGGKLLIERASLASLVMMSAGIASVYALVRRLRETEDQVGAHYVHLITGEGHERAEAEAEAVRNIVRWCQDNIRDFKYSESRVDRSTLAGSGHAAITVAFEAAMVAVSWAAARKSKLQRVITGQRLEKGNEQTRDLADRATQAFDLHYGPLTPRPTFGPINPAVDWRQQLKYLPEELREIIWTCRRPQWTQRCAPVRARALRYLRALQDGRQY